MRSWKRFCRAVACLSIRVAPNGDIYPNLDQTKDIHLKVLRSIEENPEITQRELAQKLGVSLGKINYCMRALIDRGWVKASNFKNSHSKGVYAYLLTPRGIEQKAKITVRFLKQRIRDYEQIKMEIRELEREVRNNGSSSTKVSN